MKFLRYIRDNKSLGLRYYANIYYAPLSDLLRRDIIKTENQLMVFSDSIWENFPDTERSTGAYIVIYQCGPIDNFTHLSGPFSQSSDES